jgi:YVTN family beta-propeller protein
MLTRASALSLLLLLGTAPHHAPQRTGSFQLAVPAGSYFSESRVRIGTAGISGPYALSVLGPGSIAGDTFVAARVDRPAWTTLIGASSGAVAYGSVRTVPPPPPAGHIIAVATYRSGIALHDERTFAALGNLSIAGAPADAAFLPDGSLVTADTDGDTLTRISRSPWSVHQIAGVPEANEVAVDPSTGNIFVSDRDLKGQGALTRIAADGSVTHVVTGVTAEGIALDTKRQIAYVSNVNDNTIAAVDMRTMRVLQKIPAVERPFGVALDARNRRLFVVSNMSPSMRAGGGYVAAIGLDASAPRIVARSSALRFPLGIAFDASYGRLFVTDEGADVIYVLDSTTLRQAHAPLVTCATPWRPRVAGDRLYVPCAREDRVDVFALKTLRRVKGAPFPTGGYPLSVSVWP